MVGNCAPEQSSESLREAGGVLSDERMPPPDGETVAGKSSTELRFNIYEDGSTAGRIQRNKGCYVEGYNMSIDSALLLQAYIAHVISEAKLDFRQGTQTKDDLNKMFR